jgi:hypothetical protein
MGSPRLQPGGEDRALILRLPQRREPPIPSPAYVDLGAKTQAKACGYNVGECAG